MVNWKYAAILKAKSMDGLYLPFSKEPMVCLDTSRMFANSACVMPRSFLISSSLFFRCAHLRWWQASFTFSVIGFPNDVKLAFHFSARFFPSKYIRTTKEKKHLLLRKCLSQFYQSHHSSSHPRFFHPRNSAHAMMTHKRQVRLSAMGTAKRAPSNP